MRLFFNRVNARVNIFNRAFNALSTHILSAHIFQVEVNQPTTVWPKMLVLNPGFACWCRWEFSPN